MTDLVSAVTRVDTARVRDLLAAGADPDRPDDRGTTPLYRAAVHGSTEVVRLLLAYGADPQRPGGADDEGLPLCAAACWNHIGVVEALLSAGADPDLPEPPHPEQTGPGTPPLLWAVRNGHRETVELLLAAGADPEIPGTPLTIAAQGGRLGIVRSLLAHGADPARPDELGRTAHSVATELAATDPVAYLAQRWGVPGREFTVHRQPAGDGTEVITLRYGSEGRAEKYRCRTATRPSEICSADVYPGIAPSNRVPIDAPGRLLPGRHGPRRTGRPGRGGGGRIRIPLS